MLTKKHFGQHWLHDKNIVRRIVRAINPQLGDHLVEIGPGLGALTTILLPHVNEMYAVELDCDVIPKLSETCRPLGKLHIHNVDALKFDFSTLASPLRVVGNLPYNISTELIFHLLEFAPRITDMHFMLQKEVVDRICAQPGNKTYGRLSVMAQSQCDVKKLFNVPPQAFTPPPNVDSAIIRLIPQQRYDIENPDYFNEIVKAAFGQRRKTLRNSLKNLISEEQWQQINIDPSQRPEQLSIETFAKLSKLWAC